MKNLIRCCCLVACILIAVLSMAYSQESQFIGGVEKIGDKGAIDWAGGFIYATGFGAPPDTGVNLAQRRLLAKRAAQVDAYRNLLEVVEGVHLNSTTTVENFVVSDDKIKTIVEGYVKGAQVVRIKYLRDESVEVTVRALIDGEGGFAEVLEKVTPIEKIIVDPFGRIDKSIPPPNIEIIDENNEWEPMIKLIKGLKERITILESRNATLYQAIQILLEEFREPPNLLTGIIINGSSRNVEPVAFPTIYDEDGKLVYAAKAGDVPGSLAAWTHNLNEARQHERVRFFPLEVEAIGVNIVENGRRSSIVVSLEDAQRIEAANKAFKLLDEHRVVIVF